MTSRFVKCFAALALLVSALTSNATECTASDASCSFYLNKRGDLMRTTLPDAPPLTLFAGTGAAASEYVMRRSNRYYLVREHTGDAKSFDIVPLDVSERDVVFDRILRFSQKSKKSAGSGGEVWVADELALASPNLISEFSWDRILQSLGKIRPSTDGVPGNALQPGFSAIPLTIHDSTGAVTGQRAYLYADKLGATPESIVCAANCVIETSSLTGVLRGGIGKYPITLTLTTERDRIKGAYRYDGKRGALTLDGSVKEGGAISMSEHTAARPTRSTGKFDAILDHGLYWGLWTPPSDGKQLPFFAVADSL